MRPRPAIRPPARRAVVPRPPPENMIEPHIVVTTCPRTPSYLATSLASMHQDPTVAQCPLTVIYDGSGDTAAEDIADDTVPPREAVAAVVPLLGDVAEEASSLVHPERRIYYATARAFRAAMPGRPFILCQDDVEYADRWLERARTIARRIEVEQVVERYVFAIYSTYAGHGRTLGYTAYPVKAFHGHCCLYVSAPAVADIAARYWDTRLTANVPDDIYMKEILLGTMPRIALYAAMPALAQHVGTVSARHDPEVRQSKTYR